MPLEAHNITSIISTKMHSSFLSWGDSQQAGIEGHSTK